MVVRAMTDSYDPVVVVRAFLRGELSRAMAATRVGFVACEPGPDQLIAAAAFALFLEEEQDRMYFPELVEKLTELVEELAPPSLSTSFDFPLPASTNCDPRKEFSLK